MGQDFRRMTDKACEPTEEEMLSFIGEQTKEAWLEIRQFLEDRYDLVPETIFYGAKYGWTIRYRKGGKTLCSLFPEIATNSYEMLKLLIVSTMYTFFACMHALFNNILSSYS